MDIIEFENVSKTYYPGKVPTVGLKNISLKVGKGEFLVISGASGSGKSTLLNIAGLIDYPSEGRLVFNSQEIIAKKEKLLTRLRRDYLGFIFQNFNLIPTLTAFENIEYPLLKSNPEIGKRHEIVKEALEKVELSDFAGRYPNELSGGQQQRVSIARAFAKHPAVVLADEPTANLDSKTGASVLKYMEKLNSEKKVTFILASHDPQVLSMSHRTLQLKDGSIINETFGKTRK